MALERLSTELGARKLMQRLIDSGRCTIADFDAAPPNHLNPSAYRNLLRDPDVGEAVQVSDPRDFTPNPGSTPANAPPLPLTLDQPQPPPFDADSLDF